MELRWRLYRDRIMLIVLLMKFSVIISKSMMLFDQSTTSSILTFSVKYEINGNRHLFTTKYRAYDRQCPAMCVHSVWSCFSNWADNLCETALSPTQQYGLRAMKYLIAESQS